jgi:hypothetical protein
MKWRTANHNRAARAFQKRLRRPLPPFQKTETGWAGIARAIFTPKMRKKAHVFMPPWSDAASGMPLSENNADCSRPKAGSPTAEGGDARTQSPKGEPNDT